MADFWLEFQGHGGISLLVEEGMMMVSCFQQNTGILKNPQQFKVLSSAQQSQVLQVKWHLPPNPFFVAAHQTHLHCVNWREDLLLIRVGICSDTNHIILKEFNPWLFTKSWFPRVGKWVSWMGKMNFCLILYEFVALLCSSLDLGLHLWSSTCFISIKITFFESLLIPALWLEDIAMK